MRTVYGTKTMTEDDIFEGCGGPRNIIEFVDKNLEQILTALREVIIPFKHEGYQNDFRFDFIPLETLEEFILYSTVSKSIEIALDYMATRDNIDKSKHIVSAASEKLTRAINKYSNFEKDYFCSPYDTVCVAIVYDALTEKARNFYFCIPRKIISKVEQDMEYTCSRCGKTQSTSALPDDMKYTIIDNKVVYYCSDCCTENDNVSFVGDYWPQKK